MDATSPKYLKKVVDIPLVPISGLEGDNMIERCTNLDCYKGLTPVEVAQIFSEPLRLPLHYVYEIGGIGAVPVGRVETGVVKPGMVTFGPTGLTTEVKSVEMHDKALLEALPGDNVDFNVKNVAVAVLKRVFFASNSEDDPAREAANFTSQFIIMNHPGQTGNGYDPVLDCYNFHLDDLISEPKNKIGGGIGAVPVRRFETGVVKPEVKSVKKDPSGKSVETKEKKKKIIKKIITTGVRMILAAVVTAVTGFVLDD